MSKSPRPDPAATPVSEPAPRALPELLSPAGDWDCVRAAVENGADAVYFGLDRFNARMRANNFTEADLPRLMEFLHRRGVKGYVTLNTLVFENELAEAEQYLRTMIAAGVDAVIVQDVGICRLVRSLSPDFPIHASTQMTITSLAGVEFARDLGCSLVVLARECSIGEIGKIRDAMAEAAAAEPRKAVPALLEAFVHGALCVAYSGQCLTSEALGGRSANRGECAQACRLPYQLISDGQPVPLADRKYLLSPLDLAGLEALPDLVRAGVASLKIEGRLKSPEYVANITRIYRQAIDDLRLTIDDLRATDSSSSAKLPHARQSPIANRQSAFVTDSQTQYDMEMAFSRGLHTGWLRGTNHRQLVLARFGKKRGVFLGEVERVLRDAVQVRLQAPLKPGDGIVFDAGSPEEPEEGGRVYEIQAVSTAGRRAPAAIRNHAPGPDIPAAIELRFGRGDIEFSRVHAGDKLWKTSDPELDRRLRRSFEGETPRFQRPISIEVHGLAGKPLTVLARDESGNLARASSSAPLVEANTRPLTLERLREQLGRLGGTPFKLGALDNRLEGKVLLPVSELNRLRREIVAELDRLRAQPKRWTLAEGGLSHVAAFVKTRGDALDPRFDKRSHGAEAAPELIVLVRTFPQLHAALDSGARVVYCEFEDPKKYREAVAAFRSHPSQAGSPGREIWVAPPRVFKLGEEWTLRQVRSAGADGYLIRNYDHLKYFAGDRRIGDYSLNIANRLAAAEFKNRFGLERLTASYDLNFQQLEALLKAAPADWFEVTLHQHMPLFHMEHCVFCAFLSTGTDYTNCGRPCDRHDVRLRDRAGAEHPVKADAGCRNTVFNAAAQTGAEYAPAMLSLGVRWFRVEFLNEPPEQVLATVAKYRQLLRGELSGSQVWRELKLFNQLGVTRGQMAGR
jgi:putative protease